MTTLNVISLIHDLIVEFVADLHPSKPLWTRETRSFLAETNASVQSYPEHDLGVEEVLDLATGFPNGHVLFVPDFDHVVDHAADGQPLVIGDGVSVFVVEIDTIQELAVDIRLSVEDGCVAHADRSASFVSVQMD